MMSDGIMAWVSASYATPSASWSVTVSRYFPGVAGRATGTRNAFLVTLTGAGVTSSPTSSGVIRLAAPAGASTRWISSSGAASGTTPDGVITPIGPFGAAAGSAAPDTLGAAAGSLVAAGAAAAPSVAVVAALGAAAVGAGAAVPVAAGAAGAGGAAVVGAAAGTVGATSSGGATGANATSIGSQRTLASRPFGSAFLSLIENGMSSVVLEPADGSAAKVGDPSLIPVPARDGPRSATGTDDTENAVADPAAPARTSLGVSPDFMTIDRVNPDFAVSVSICAM